MLRRCEAVTTPTETAAELLRAMGYSGPLSAISNGVDTSRFRPGPRPVELARRLGVDERPVVLYTGRLDAEKQMDVWLHAAAVLTRALDVQFLVGGKGSERTRLEALAQELGLDGRLHFFGYLSDEEYPQVYRLADAFCITSEVELQSIATLEAIASGVPAVGVRAGGAARAHSGRRKRISGRPWRSGRGGAAPPPPPLKPGHWQQHGTAQSYNRGAARPEPHHCEI